MAEPIKDVTPVAVVPVTPIEPSKTAQPTPVAAVPTGDPSKDVKQVPLPALQEERAKRQEAVSTAEKLTQEIADLKQMVANQQLQPQQNQQPQLDPRAELDQVWEDDPKQAVRMEIMYAMDWRDRQDSSLNAQADGLATRYKDFNDFRSVAMTQVRNLPLNQRGNPGVLEAAYFMARGQGADAMIQQREAALLEKYRNGEINAQGLATPASGAFTAPPTDPSLQITEEQARVASAMGLSNEEYMSGGV